ncbi:hypothetical protein BHC49_04735 [Snodgrassella alvi]|uniref:Uncharacterized protein n=2 Tax=Snodgrassella alvi TaxID=1196083 RepID=A0A2N9XZ49_9NEIS|nr:hypothetical protein BHC49_04735 [Snodgrassella alvi]
MIMDVEKIELTRSEVNALTKAILYLKFDCEEIDSLFYCSSPIINSIFEKLIRMYGYQKDWDRIFSNIPEMNKSIAIDKIANYEKQNNRYFDEKTKNEILEKYLFPYKLDK